MSIPEEIQDQLFQYRYRTHFHLSVEQFDNEPWEAKWQARTIWTAEADRERMKPQAQHGN